MQPGETLWSIAAANNLTTRTVAAFNGAVRERPGRARLDDQRPDHRRGRRRAAGRRRPARRRRAAGRGRPPRPPRRRRSGAPAVLGSYVVRAGDTLSGLAANAGVAMAQMAAANGLDPSGAAADRHRAQAAVRRARRRRAPPSRCRRQRVVPAAGAAADAARALGAADIQSVASQYGVSPSLAAAIAWQESGFNNGMVSSANARGVMQVMPGTWRLRASRTSRGRQLDAELGDRQRPRRRALPPAPARSRPAATRTPRSPATTRASARSARAACSTTRSSTSRTCRRCARASGGEGRAASSAPEARGSRGILAPRAAPRGRVAVRSSLGLRAGAVVVTEGPRSSSLLRAVRFSSAGCSSGRRPVVSRPNSGPSRSAP